MTKMQTSKCRRLDRHGDWGSWFDAVCWMTGRACIVLRNLAPAI